MCGIAGFFAPDGLSGHVGYTRLLKQMTDRLVHRGPDAEGHWVHEEAGVGLGHRRLSIVDLTPTGAQPMVSHSGQLVLAYNGEIYNHHELRRELDEGLNAPKWRGTSDTEVLLELIEQRGIESALQAADGMFALALWNRQTRTLTLARDRFGEKPLYYGWAGKALAFASELKALRSFPGFDRSVNPSSVASFMTYSFVPAPASIYSDIHKLEPAGFITFDAAGVRERHKETSAFWSAREAAIANAANPFKGSLDEACARSKELLDCSIRRRMVADVPLGSLLSGGIDSSLVTALMQEQSTKPIKTFCIGMEMPGFNEADHARAVAAHLGCDHTELMLQPGDVLEQVPLISSVYDEPFADSSQIPTLIVSRLARQDVTVAISGDGGDEIFGGYNRYFHGRSVLNMIERYPGFVRQAGAVVFNSAGHPLFEKLGSLVPGRIGSEFSSGRGSEKMSKLAGLVTSTGQADLLQRLLSTGPISWLSPGLRDQIAKLSRLLDGPQGQQLDFTRNAMLLDTLSYLPDDILAKVDRASMAVSLEMRTPFLNRQVFEFAWQLPPKLLTSQTVGKLVPRELLYKLVPREIVDRPKSGFAVPLGRWFRSELKEWVEDNLSSLPRHCGDYLDVAAVRKAWRVHAEGKANHETALWSVLMLNDWLASQQEA